ncbi:MAG: helix-turn-helix domain-containing protein, partial [Candidatus Thermoplasmatota archaeon]|nr:helix-turn-helix domain-containing protein [Candidatus Thermoplasmatota archaeon]
RSRACSACRLMASMDSLIIRSQFHSTDAIEYTILCSSIGAAKSIVEVLRTGGLRAILLSAGEVSYPLSLTAREIEILLIAHERGLFDDKRRTTVRELAKELSISATTLSNIIRRSVRKIVELQLESVR